MYTSPLYLLSILSIPHQTFAWGNLGHETIAYIAQNFLSPSTQLWAETTLNDTSPSYLASIATWADTYKYTSEGSFSKPFHYIDAEDNPPATCNVDFERDCGEEGCSVSAIANYTQRVRNPAWDLSAEEVNEALRFLVHFIGDITQPLHDEAYEIGGNEVAVTFDGETTNLHSIWDTEMPEQLRGGYSLTDAKTWADNLTAEIQSGVYRDEAASWLNGLDINDAQASALAWAADANAFVCSVVMPENSTVLQQGDLYPGYYDGAVDTVELQIAKAGYRLAAWLDAIADEVLGGNGTDVMHVMRRKRKVGVSEGRGLYPERRHTKSHARLRREAFGYGCRHKH